MAAKPILLLENKRAAVRKMDSFSRCKSFNFENVALNGLESRLNGPSLLPARADNHSNEPTSSKRLAHSNMSQLKKRSLYSDESSDERDDE